MRYLASLLASLLTLLTLVVVAAPQPALAQDDEAAWLLAQINALRQRNGVAPLVVNPHLTASATAHSNYLATHPYLDPHREANGSTPQTRILDAGYPGRLVGENVVGGTGANVQWGFNWWMNSPIHLHNMLAGWTEIGIGIAQGPYGRWYTTDFGDQGAGLVAPSATPAPDGDSAPQGGAAQAPDQPRPTRRPPTRAPTLTPTITYTPSITYTPRATFTPTFTPTGRPPTETPIVLDVSPQPAAGQAVAFAPTTAAAPGSSPVAVAVADVGNAGGNEAAPVAAPPATKGNTSDAIRGLIPWFLLLQGIIVGGLVVNSVIRRRRG